MNAIALALLKQHEGCRLTAYQDGGGVWTCGYGATGPEVKQGTVWTQAQADARLESDLYKAEMAVRGALNVALSDQSLAALVSFVFNVGAEAFRTSTLRALVNASLTEPAAREFMRWDHDNGKEVKGLLLRRLDEASLFLRGC